MMKGFAKKGKYLAMMLLAFSLIFAGCATGGSSEEDSAGINDQGGVAAIPFKMDMDSGKLTVGDGTGPVVANINGHTVEVVNGNSTLTQCLGTGPYECWLRVWNRDSDEYMANVFVTLSRCPDCDAYPWQLDNADAFNTSDPAFPTLSDAFTVHTSRDGFALIPGEVGAASPINTVGIAYVSDVYFPEILQDPSNPYGAPLRLMPSSVYKNDWMIMPQCGMRSQPWIFSGSFPDPQFEFWGTVVADYFPMTPIGDPRYNTTTKSTLYIILSDVVNTATTDPYISRFRNGTPQRSNVLAGFGAPGNVSVTTRSISGLQYYFGLTLGMEASDWMENQVYADYRVADGYYYYGVVSTLISWDSNVATGISISGNTKKTGGTALTASYQWLALNVPVDYNQDKYSTYASLKFVDWAEQSHFASVSCRLNDPSLGTQNKFRFFPVSGSYIDDAGRKIWIMSSNIPKVMGQRGFAKVVWQGLTSYSGAYNIINSIDTGYIQDGIDPDVDIWAYTRIYKLNKNASAIGTGTEFRAETFSGFFDFRVYHNNKTMTGPVSGGPFAPGTDDIMDPTVPGGCSEEFCTLLGGLEVSNWQIRHRGNPIEGTYQAWNVGICIAP